MLTDTTYVDQAEKTIQALSKNRNGKYFLTTSKIRRLLSLTSALYDEVQYKEFSEIQERLSYLRIQFVYQAGRERSVKEFVVKANILNHLEDIHDKDSLIRFCRYMEALVAYFKYYGGED